MITVNALIEKFRQALAEHWGYIWGTAGEKWTAAKQKELERTTDPDRAQGRAYGSKWIGKTVADCSGLFSWAFKQLGGYMYHGSDTMYRKYCNAKGELKKGKRTDCGALKPGTAVFVWNGKKYSHVGLFVGGETVIEAMGTVHGVTTSKVTAGKWTHWGELAGVDYKNSQFTIQNSELGENGVVKRTVRKGNKGEAALPCHPERSEVDPSKFFIKNLGNGSPTECGSFPTLRKGSKGQAVTEVQARLTRLGYDLGPCGIDGDFGKCTEAAVRRFQKQNGLKTDGICGVKTWTKLLEVS